MGYVAYITYRTDWTSCEDHFSHFLLDNKLTYCTSSVAQPLLSVGPCLHLTLCPLTTPFIHMAFLLVKVWALMACHLHLILCTWDACGVYHLHPSHRFLSSWAAVMLTKDWPQQGQICASSALYSQTVLLHHIVFELLNILTSMPWNLWTTTPHSLGI